MSWFDPIVDAIPFVASGRDIGEMAGIGGGGGGGASGGGGAGMHFPSYDLADPELNQIFQSTLGRAPTGQESAYYKQLAKEGALHPQEIVTFLQGTTEASKGRMPEYEGYLARNDQGQLGRAMDALQSRFAGQGRQIGGSGYTQAYMNAARDLAEIRQGKLADYYSQNVEGGYQRAGQEALGQQRKMQDTRLNRQFGMEDYYRQKGDYDNYLNQANRLAKEQAWLGAGTSLLGAGIGAMAGPGGAMIGSQAGSQAFRTQSAPMQLNRGGYGLGQGFGSGTQQFPGMNRYYGGY